MITVTPTPQRLRVLGYIRVSTAEQASSGLGLEAQRAQLERSAQASDWDLLEVLVDTTSGKDMQRPELQRALARLALHEAQALVVTKLDRLSRSVLDFSQLLVRAGSEGWQVIALDLGMDMTSPTGEAIANVVASFAQLERRLIGQRTREALAIARAKGVRLGRPVELAPELELRIVGMRERNLTLRAIADELNAEGVAPARGGGRWYSSTVHRVLERHPDAPKRRVGFQPKIATG